MGGCWLGLGMGGCLPTTNFSRVSTFSCSAISMVPEGVAVPEDDGAGESEEVLWLRIARAFAFAGRGFPALGAGLGL